MISPISMIPMASALNPTNREKLRIRLPCLPTSGSPLSVYGK
jgi:hypothetical protein